jgi:quercetin dioxygenase-like cupin family protein
MANRKSFLQSMGIMGSMLLAPAAFANSNPKEPSLQPILSNRKKENSYWYMGHLISLLLTTKETNGDFALLQAIERRGFEPPPHIHTKEDESFIILKGEVEYTVDNQKFTAMAGDVMFLPKNIQHSFKIQTETLETMILLSPGGFENYFVEMSEPAGALELPPVPKGRPDIEKLIATASRYGIKFPKL